MPAKEFLLNRNEVVYCTACSRKFEPNYDGVVVKNDSENTFCIDLALDKHRVHKPAVNVIKAVPFKGVKEKFIEKNYNVLIPVGTKMPEIDNFLIRVGKFSDKISDGINQADRGIRKVRKGDVIKYKTKEGAILLEFGEKVGEEEYVKQYTDGPITDVEVPVQIQIKENSVFGNSKKSGRKDSIGNDFDPFSSPDEDIFDFLEEIIKSEVNTIANTSFFKIVIKRLYNVTCVDKDAGRYIGFVNCRMLSLTD